MVEFQYHGRAHCTSGRPAGAFKIGAQFLFNGMGRMVRTNDIDAVIHQSLADGIPVRTALDRRVALDKGTFHFVIAIIKEEVVHTGLCGNPLLIQSGPAVNKSSSRAVVRCNRCRRVSWRLARSTAMDEER